MTTSPDPLRSAATAKPEKWSAAELAEVVNTWCRLHGVEPVSGQAAPELTERIVRFYRTQGIIDAPQGSGSSRASFGRKHRLQLNLLRLLQAEGMPLRRIQELLFGRSEDELAALEQQAIMPGNALLPRSAADALRAEPAAAESVAEDPAAYGGSGPRAQAPALDQAVHEGSANPYAWPSWKIGPDFAVITLSGRQLSASELSAINAVLYPQS
ncbi:MAG: MerR family transcriptional regulator [Candidatus Methylacidiphilales bacterium]|nr:MerR family transcriptional regulator [Candidatus Methylacidiphilales bacterium]